MKQFYLSLGLSLFLFSCNKTKDLIDETGIITYNKVIKNHEKVKDFFSSDESIKQRRIEYDNYMLKTFPEYENVYTFFSKIDNPLVLEKNGDLYRINKITVDDDGSLEYINPSIDDERKYFYKTDKNFYIYTFKIDNNKITECIGIRRIENSAYNSQVHDLIFENDKLIKEEFIGKVIKDFFDKDETQFFKIKKRIDDNRVITIYNLGKIKNF